MSRDLEVAPWTRRFETPEREVYAKREAIVAAMGLEPGDRVADIGAGTGAHIPALLRAVGDDGHVTATELSNAFRLHLKQRGALEWDNLAVIRSYRDRSNLRSASFDAALMVDVYHHLDEPVPFVTDVARALKPGGKLHIVDFDPGREGASDWVKGHVYSDVTTMTRQVLSTGHFEWVASPELGMTENRMTTFRRITP